MTAIEPALSITNNSRIKALQEDLQYFRSLLKQMVPDITPVVGHNSIWKSRNSMLGDNCRKMHKKYLDLLNTTQVQEAEKHLRMLESELSDLQLI